MESRAASARRHSKTITIDDSEIRDALSEGVSTILNAIRVALERTHLNSPPTFLTEHCLTAAAAC